MPAPPSTLSSKLARLGEDLLPELANQTGVFGNGNEICGTDMSALGVVPACERFEAFEAPRTSLASSRAAAIIERVSKTI